MAWNDLSRNVHNVLPRVRETCSVEKCQRPPSHLSPTGTQLCCEHFGCAGWRVAKRRKLDYLAVLEVATELQWALDQAAWQRDAGDGEDFVASSLLEWADEELVGLVEKLMRYANVTAISSGFEPPEPYDGSGGDSPDD